MLAAQLQTLFPGIKIGPGDAGDECILGDRGIAVWRRAEKQPTLDELKAAEPAALAAEQAEEAKRIESTTARDDAKRALAALDTIIAGAPTATTAQMRTAIEQLARIQKHAILATLGR